MSSANEPGIAWRTSSHSGNGGACVEVGWHTSSHSGTNGNCVEVGWRPSSYSASNSGCVEVARSPVTVRLRDSKDRTGPALTFPAAAWRAFLATITR